MRGQIQIVTATIAVLFATPALADEKVFKVASFQISPCTRFHPSENFFTGSQVQQAPQTLNVFVAVYSEEGFDEKIQSDVQDCSNYAIQQSGGWQVVGASPSTALPNVQREFDGCIAEKDGARPIKLEWVNSNTVCGW